MALSTPVFTQRPGGWNMRFGAMACFAALVIFVLVMSLEVSVDISVSRGSRRSSTGLSRTASHIKCDPSSTTRDTADTASASTAEATDDAAESTEEAQAPDSSPAPSEGVSTNDDSDLKDTPFRVSAAAKAVCHQYPQPKVAFVFVGHPRSLFMPSVYTTIRMNLIEAFGGEPTVFITLLEATRELRNVNYDQGKVIDRDVNKTIFEDALKVLRPAHLQWYDAKGPDELFNKNCVWNDPWDNGRMFRYLSQIYSLEVGWPPVVEYEKKHNMQFDVVIRARPDLLWTRSIDPYCMFPSDTVFSSHALPPNWLPAADHVHVIPRKFADDFFNQVSVYKSCQGSLPFNPNMCCGGGPTGYGVAFLKWKGVPHVWEKREDGFGPYLPVYLVRNPGEFERTLEFCKTGYGSARSYFPDVETCMKVLYKPPENPF